VTREGDRVKVTRWLMNELPAPFHKKMGEFPDGMKVDRWQIATSPRPASSSSTSVPRRSAPARARATAAEA
jgi:hypothetical protein